MRKRRGFCNHYRAMSEHDTCEAGVCYETLKGVPFEQRPCFFKGDPPATKSTLCELALYPTPKELAERDAELAKRFEDIGTARAAIVLACGGPWKKGARSEAGEIDCPVCNGAKTLRFSRAGFNGHIHAACKTPSCVAWME